VETNTIKPFAKEARLILMEGILQRLKYWGFKEDGSNDQQLESTQGGYIFRGQVYTDTTVPAKWNKLKKLLTSEQAVQDIIEATAYTWFNRLMAIKILEANGYIQEQIAYTDGMRTPMIVQNAKRGQNELNSQGDRNLLLEYLQDDKEEQAFGVLITSLCNRNGVLHDVFGRIDDYTEILLPQNLLQTDGLIDLINSDSIALEDYKEVELIGWLYQFYISDKKDEVFKGFKKNIKARAEDIPAATQIFTPKWIVKYMVENTVGKIYLDYEPSSSLREQMKYLVENDSDKDINNSTLIIDNLSELTLIDPACGSGHILVTGFELFFKIYREAGYTAAQAVEHILKHNIFGLDIDDRAMQLAQFAVLLKAAKYDASILDKGLMPHVYSFPEPEHFVSEELQTFLGHDKHAFAAELKDALALLNQGKNIGSALKVFLSSEAQTAVQAQYNSWLSKEKGLLMGIEELGIWLRLKPLLEVLLVLTKQYTAVVANPPYMQSKNFNSKLKDYVDVNYPSSKTDLCTVFIEMAFHLCVVNGFIGEITMQSWMFLASFKKLRKEIVFDKSILTLIDVGWNLFDNHSFPTSVLCLNNSKDYFEKGKYYDLTNTKTDRLKETEFWNTNNHYYVNQDDLKLIPNNPIAYWISHNERVLFERESISKQAEGKKGLSTGKNDLFVRSWFEVSNKLSKINSLDEHKYWIPLNKGGDFRKWYGNNEYLINWRNNGEEIKKFKGSVVRNEQYYLQSCISWGLVSYVGFSARFSDDGYIFEAGGTCLFSDDKFYLLGFLSTKICQRLLKAINPTINYNIADVINLPCVRQNESIVNKASEECVSISKKDWNSKEISWDFEKTPLLNDKTSLKESYQIWYDGATIDFFQLHTNEEELNRIFIEIYGLEDELTPDVALKDITILQDELDKKDLEALESTFRKKGKEAIDLPIKKDEVLSQFISYCIGVSLGRYRLDKPGLNIAHPNPTEEELASYQLTINHSSLTIIIDDDGILPIMGEDSAFPDDALGRTKELLLAIWGEETLTENINFLHECVGVNLHKWLTEKFWSYHTSMYKKKPIYWLFASNPKKPQNAAFKVLVYMHRMDKYTVQKIQRNYLHPHQEHIKRELEKLRENEDSLNKEELKHLEQLHNWELECRDYNEVLKELANQQIEFDLDDGVTVNYALFEGAVAVI